MEKLPLDISQETDWHALDWTGRREEGGRRCWIQLPRHPLFWRVSAGIWVVHSSLSRCNLAASLTLSVPCDHHLLRLQVFAPSSLHQSLPSSLSLTWKPLQPPTQLLLLQPPQSLHSLFLGWGGATGKCLLLSQSGSGHSRQRRCSVHLTP